MSGLVNRGSDYSEEEIELGLTVLALYAGNRRRASEALKVKGIEIPETTLRDWRLHYYPERYAAIHAQSLPSLRERVAEECEELIFDYAQAEREALNLFLANLDKADPKDAGKLAQQFAVAKGINVDKSNVNRDRPTQITQHRGAEEILRGLRQRLRYDADSDAEEVDAQLVA